LFVFAISNARNNRTKPLPKNLKIKEDNFCKKMKGFASCQGQNKLCYIFCKKSKTFVLKKEFFVQLFEYQIIPAAGVKYFLLYNSILHISYDEQHLYLRF